MGALAILAWLGLIYAVRSETCVASYYSHGRVTASGEPFRPSGFSAAHRTIPFGTHLRVSFKGKSVIVKVNDRGPFVRGRSLDLSKGAARAIGLLRQGRGVVQVSRL